MLVNVVLYLRRHDNALSNGERIDDGILNDGGFSEACGVLGVTHEESHASAFLVDPDASRNVH